MKIEVVYESGQTYNEQFSVCNVEVYRTPSRIVVQFKSKDSKKSGRFTLKPEHAESLAKALSFVASSVGTEPAAFSMNEQVLKAAAA